MSGPSDAWTELRALLRLGLPAAGTQLAAMMLGVVDTMMVGRLSTEALDAAALGNLWIFGTTVFGMGLLWGMDPLMSQAHGAQDGMKVARTLHAGLLLVVFLVPQAIEQIGRNPANIPYAEIEGETVTASITLTNKGSAMAMLMTRPKLQNK